MNPKKLRLNLTPKWFDMTKAGIKTEDYREMTPYWYSILCLYEGKKQTQKFWQYAPKNLLSFNADKITFQKFFINVVLNGYPSNRELNRIQYYEHKGIVIRTGKEEWGAVPNKQYFVILHGNKLSIF